MKGLAGGIGIGGGEFGGVVEHDGRQDARRDLQLDALDRDLVVGLEQGDVGLVLGEAGFGIHYENQQMTQVLGYAALVLILVALIVRNLGFEYRHKRPEAQWKARWDQAIFWGSLVPALLWGVAATLGPVVGGRGLVAERLLMSKLDSSWIMMMCGRRPAT